MLERNNGKIREFGFFDVEPDQFEAFVNSAPEFSSSSEDYYAARVSYKDYAETIKNRNYFDGVDYCMRKVFCIPISLLVFFVKAPIHLFKSIYCSHNKDEENARINKFKAKRDLEESLGNFVFIFNSNLGECFIAEAKLNKNLYDHEFDINNLRLNHNTALYSLLDKNYGTYYEKMNFLENSIKELDDRRDKQYLTKQRTLLTSLQSIMLKYEGNIPEKIPDVLKKLKFKDVEEVPMRFSTIERDKELGEINEWLQRMNSKNSDI